MNAILLSIHANHKAMKRRGYSYFALLSLFSCIISGCTNSANSSETPSETPAVSTIVINFDTGGAAGTAPATMNNIQVGTTILLPEPTGLAKTGYFFGGWSENGGKTVQWANEQSKPINAETTFTAIWKPPFISVWKTRNPNQSITLPLVQDGKYDFTVDWGDNSTDEIKSNNARHSYSTPGTYTITITGRIKGWSFRVVDISEDAILDIKSWGSLDFGETQGQLSNCSNLKITATDAPTLSGPSLYGTFYNATSLTTIPGAKNWDVSNVTDMSYMFSGATDFDQDLSGWMVKDGVKHTEMFRFSAMESLTSKHPKFNP